MYKDLLHGDEASGNGGSAHSVSAGSELDWVTLTMLC